MLQLGMGDGNATPDTGTAKQFPLQKDTEHLVTINFRMPCNKLIGKLFQNIQLGRRDKAWNNILGIEVISDFHQFLKQQSEANAFGSA
jgi:hypothetical protein